MAAFLPDAWIVDAIIALVAVEAIVLVLWRALTGGGLPVAETLANLSSGAALLLALRMAIPSGALSTSVLTLLSVALIAHVANLAEPMGSSDRRPGRSDRRSSVDISSRSLFSMVRERLVQELRGGPGLSLVTTAYFSTGPSAASAYLGAN